MRLALQALFSTTEANEEGAARRALLERRLRTSERSAGFFRRLRAVVDDESLLAPEIFAEESFPDANVVAEYLDGQTEPELTRAYENACWDSEVMLAEIGRCYDILNNDSLNSVVAPKNCRRRLYYIAWEEKSVENSPTKEEDASILTNFAPFASEESEVAEAPQDETPICDAPKAEKKRNKKTTKFAKSSESVKSAGSVGATLAAERSLGRRARRLSARLTFALSVLAAASYCGWQAFDDGKRSETFPLETPKEELVVSNTTKTQDESVETPLCPTTISSAASEEFPTISLADSDLPAEIESFDGFAGASPATNAESELPKLAALPNVTVENEAKANSNEPASSVERARVGLGGSDPWERRPTLEIPAQNNDVFSKTQRY